MKIKKIVLYFIAAILFTLVIALLYTAVRSFLIAAPDFIYDLKTKPAKPVAYLPERDDRLLAPDRRTVAYFSDEHPFQTGEILQTMGIPAYRCEKITDANASGVLLLDLNGARPKRLDPKTIAFLENYVRRGGVLIGSGLFRLKQAEILKLFGLKGFSPNQSHTRMDLAKSPLFDPYLTLPEERHYRLAAHPGKVWTNTLILGSAKPLATYEDNATALSINTLGSGKAIALGMSLYDLRFRNLVGLDADANLRYINHYEPLSDFLPLFLKGIYRHRVQRGFTLSTAQGSARATVLVTHDVDFVDSLHNMKRFYELEESEGVKATYNIWTKYLKDDKDVPFFTPENVKNILEAQRLGFEIGSHTVEHTANFDKLPVGTCLESYPSYRPYSKSYTEDAGKPTLCGEVKVSKELLLGIGVKRVVTFRSGELLYHPHLPEVLERFGYRYSSCLSAEDVLSYFPYRYMHDFYTLRDPSKIWEFPLVYEDEKFPPLIFRLGQAKRLLKKIARNGGVFTLLVHPDLTWWNLKYFDIYFLKYFLQSLPSDINVSTMADYGHFWDVRDRIVWRYSPGKKGADLRLWAPESMTIALVPFGWRGGFREGEGYTVEKGRILLHCQKGWNRWHLVPSS
jgi:peptidoglycan/xylan/chitin deacetylase (PgdA/CDA1 family)